MRQKDMTKIKYAVLIVVLIASLSCGIREKNIRQGFENLLKNEFSEDEPGGIILVQKGSKIIFIKSYGVSDINRKKKLLQVLFLTQVQFQKPLLQMQF